MKRLWVHEILRVFGDRLVDEIDIKRLIRQTGVTLKERMEVSMEELFEDLLITPKKERAKYVRSHRCLKIKKITFYILVHFLQITMDMLRNLIYCDFTDPKADIRLYQEVIDLEQLREIVETYLSEYNSMTRKPMNLVLFR
jgi:dynein heavy chain